MSASATVIFMGCAFWYGMKKPSGRRHRRGRTRLYVAVRYVSTRMWVVVNMISWFDSMSIELELVNV